MFAKSENPQLFFFVAQAYQRLFPRENISPILATSLTDEQLSKITSVEINASAFAECNIKSLNGIEKLPNLEEFILRGQSDTQNVDGFRRVQQQARKGIYNKREYNSPQEFLQDNSRYFVDSYNASQITDLTPLQRCSGLKKIDLSEQHSLGEIDVSFWHNLLELNMKNCKQLYTIKGLESLRAVKNPAEKTDDFDASQLSLNFTGCDFLRHVGGFDQYVNAAVDYADYEYPMQLPTTCFCNLHRQYPESMHRLIMEQQAGEKAIYWTECCENFKFMSSSAKMNMAKNRADNIIRTVCAGQEKSPMGQVAQVYRWICDNVTYDYKGLEAAGKDTRPKPDLEEKSDPFFLNAYSHNKIRTMHSALFSKTAVCVGVSNLFNFLVSDLGYLTSSIYCSSESADDPHLTIANHQMSAVYVQEDPYYCDPTWDLGGRQSRYFCLTGEEVSKDHNFTISEAGANKTPPSLQAMLQNAGYLQTQQPASTPFSSNPTQYNQ